MVRIVFILVLSLSAYALVPSAYPAFPAWACALGGFVLGGFIIFFEVRLEKVSLKRLIGAAFGSVLGIFGAFLMSLVLSRAGTPPFLQVWISRKNFVLAAEFIMRRPHGQMRDGVTSILQVEMGNGAVVWGVSSMEDLYIRAHAPA